MTSNKKKISSNTRLLVSKDIDIYEDFDNFNTIRFKISNLLKEKIPIEFISIEGNSIDDYTYSTIQVICASKFNPENKKVTLTDEYSNIMEQFPDTEYFDIAFVYKSVMDKYSENKIKYLNDTNDNLTTPENILIAINNMFIDINPENPLSFKNIEELKKSYEIWVSNNKIKIQQQEENYSKLIEDQEELAKIKLLKYSEFILETSVYNVPCKIKNLDGTSYIGSIEDGIEIFKHAVVNSTIPYIRYVDNKGESKFWIYNKDPNINFDNYTKTKIKSNINYIILWYNIGNGKYIECDYYIDKGKINFEIPNKNNFLIKIIDAIQEALPLLVLDEPSQIRIQGYFDVEDISIDSLSYYYTLRTESLHRTYLYMEETTNAWADNSNINILYKNSKKSKDESDTTASIKISFDNLSDHKNDDIINDEDQKEKGKNKLRVYVKKAESESELEKFLLIFCRLLNKYKQDKEDNLKRLKSIIPDNVKDNTKSKKSNIKINIEKKIDNLRKKAPELYDDMGRKVQLPKQPLIISADEVEEWRQYGIDNVKDKKKSNTNLRNVMPFPPLKPNSKNVYENILTIDPYDERVKYWFVCPNDKYPNPYLIENDSSEYPYIPCCGKKDTLSDAHRSKGEVNNYFKYHDPKEVKVQKPSKTGTYHIMTSKILKSSPSNQTGEFGKNLSQLLSLYNKESNEYFKRYGIIIGTNSLIHCVLTAIKDKKYIDLKKDTDKEKYAQNVRTYIAENINPNIFKQELYDYSNDEIISEILNNNIDFSPEKFYRGLEELFNINIFVFNPGTTKNKNIDSDDEETLFLEIPRNKLIHIRYLREKLPTVIIYRHWGSDTDKMKFPHCELIISETETEEEKNKILNNYKFIFNSQMTKLLYSTLEESVPNYLWTINSKITTRINPFSKIDWQNLFLMYPIIGQQIDSYGKMRCIALQIKKNVVINLFIPPSQPLNVDIIEKVNLVEEELAISLLGYPSGIDKNGLWFAAIDFVHCIYVPTIVSETIVFNNKEIKTNKYSLKIKSGDKRKITDNLPEEPIFNLQEDTIKKSLDIINLSKRNIYYLIQIIRWLLYLKYKIEKYKDKSFDYWWDKFFIIDDKVSNIPNNEYLLTTKLPDVETITQAIQEFSEYWPTFFIDKKVHLYTNLYNKLYFFFKKENEYMSSLAPLLTIKYLKDLYINENDFMKKSIYDNEFNIQKLKDCRIFLNTQQFEIWLNTFQKPNNNLSLIFNKADSSHITNSIPYIYKDLTTGKIFIIQNVQGGEFNKVINLCIHWEKEQVNLGFKTISYKDEIKDIPYVIYSISKSSSLILIDDHSNNDLNYYYIIRYNTDDRYAAMLPIL